MFEVGNLCKVIKPWGLGTLQVGDKVVIKKGQGKYSVLNLDSGCGCAWVSEDHLEFIDKGGTHLIEQCEINRKKTEEKNKDINYIKENYPNISSISFNMLLLSLGHNSAFNYNGEYFALYADVQAFFPTLNAIFSRDLELALDEVCKIIKPQYIDKYKDNVKLLYSKVWEVEKVMED